MAGQAIKHFHFRDQRSFRYNEIRNVGTIGRQIGGGAGQREELTKALMAIGKIGAERAETEPESRVGERDIMHFGKGTGLQFLRVAYQGAFKRSTGGKLIDVIDGGLVTFSGAATGVAGFLIRTSANPAMARMERAPSEG